MYHGTKIVCCHQDNTVYLHREILCDICQWLHSTTMWKNMSYFTIFEFYTTFVFALVAEGMVAVLYSVINNHWYLSPILLIIRRLAPSINVHLLLRYYVRLKQNTNCRLCNNANTVSTLLWVVKKDLQYNNFAQRDRQILLYTTTSRRVHFFQTCFVNDPCAEG